MRRKRRAKSDQKLLHALVCGATVEGAARQAGVSERTVFRRQQDPAFQAELQAARQENVGRTTAMLTAASIESVKTLLRLQGEDMPPAVQLGAAKAILDLGLKHRESTELYERVAAIEATLSGAA